MIFLTRLFLACALCASFSAYAEEHSTPSPSQEEIINKFYRLGTIFEYIDKVYVDEVDKKQLIDDAIKGMISGLDPHSDYLQPVEQKKLMENSSGQFGGLGIVISKKDDVIEVVSPIDDTPAYRKGLKAGDLIIKIDDTVTTGMSLEDAVNLMRGTPGTAVDITISRKKEKPFTVNIVRDVITITSAKAYLLDEGLGYIRISNFQEPTTNLVKKAITKLNTDSEEKVHSLIIDLRNNPGGLLTSAIEISDLFLDNEELIVYTKGKLSNQFSEFFATPGDDTDGANIVVLINEGSASASEILAGALQDHKRALIVGKKSFGKGSVQNIIELDDGYGLKVTTARYYTPNGRSIQAKGIVPDVALQDVEFSIKEEDDSLSVTEANLDNHLGNGQEEDSSDENTAEETTDELTADEERIAQLKADYYVHEATNLLKALKILGN